ncbi:MAG: putative 4-hydroxybenzoate polyprenyltransferase [Planctomycetes bacterium]|nr:putative 4-hydroxybenzoate polyprenyltransferase [Planctomycetota bacterium]
MAMQSPIKLIKTYASFVKIAHTIFALPFALVGMLAAYAVPTGFVYVMPGPDGSMPGGSFDRHVYFFSTTLILILLCMVGARSFAMAVNRIIDRKIDARNPRTAVRELPSGAMSLGQAWVFATAMAGIYFGACWYLGDVVLWLSPIPIALMLLYPLTKRFTWLCHMVLGASLGLAPVGAWVAVRSQFDTVLNSGFAESVSSDLGWSAVSEPLPWLVGGAVMLWVAGFDVVYALQDDEFDRENKLHSIPAKFGRRGALWISRGMHVVSAMLFFAFTWMLTHPAPTGGMDTRQYTQIAEWVWAAPCVMLAGMLYQHSLVRADDLKRVNLAFFTVNGVISVVFGAVFLAAYLLG